MTATTTAPSATPTDAKPHPSAHILPYLNGHPLLLDIVRHRAIYVGISLALVIPALVFMVLMMIKDPNHSPVKLGIDFTGGSLMEVAFYEPISPKQVDTIRTVFAAHGDPNPIIQVQTPRLSTGLGGSGFTTPPPPKADPTLTAESPSAAPKGPIQSVVSIRTKTLGPNTATPIERDLNTQVGAFTILQKNTVGPTLASEILTNGLLALLLAYTLIVGYLTFRFQLDYAVCAVVALVHDTLFVLGAFALLGYCFGVEVDSLFVTALLTVVGFSVHDTIVVFDRLRENTRVLYSKKLPFADIANISLNQTLARSINTSMTALLPLLTLYFFGGSTTQTFVGALILGIFTGTFSSICVASLLLVWWRERTSAPVAA